LLLWVVIFYKCTKGMVNHRPIARRRERFPLRVETVEFGGRRFFLTAQDHDARAWVMEIAERRVPLIKFRAQFRRVIQAQPIGGLVSCLIEAHPGVRKLAVWLLGHCDVGRSATALSELRSAKDASLRRQVAKALRRMGKWVELQSMAIYDPDDRVRRIAGSQARFHQRSHGDRLRNYVTHGGRELIQPGTYVSRMALFISPSVGAGKPAKTRQWIRRLLEHIQELVRRSRGRAA
jgi:hypothetical protein